MRRGADEPEDAGILGSHFMMLENNRRQVFDAIRAGRSEAADAHVSPADLPRLIRQVVEQSRMSEKTPIAVTSAPAPGPGRRGRA